MATNSTSETTSHSLLGHGLTVSNTGFDYLKAHANVRNLREPLSPETIAFLKIYRHVAIVVSLMLTFSVVHVGGILLSLEMAKILEPAQLGTQTNARKQILDRNSSTPADDEARTNLLGFLAQPLPIDLLFWMSVFTSERGPKLLRRGLVPGLIYTCLFISFTVMLDLILSLQSVWARVSLFVSVAALMAPLRMVWTHSAVTGERTRIPDYINAFSRSQHAILMVPSLLHAFSCCALLLLPSSIAWSCEWRSLKLDLASVSYVLAIPTT
ncbi:hypothetical protein D0864_12861 [Hortaea werneckii]|uniref:Uncharacterized protein n=1 Tax=Hortaea werneckii TaxID=91943 RepID=A0A3M7DCP3_HORWE|nr:hypothetical protein D0864_12861 [Hortaea werneckii]